MIDFSDLVGKTVRITMQDGTMQVGYILTHTPALDNEDGVETIDVMPNKSARHGICIDVPEIEHIEILS